MEALFKADQHKNLLGNAKCKLINKDNITDLFSTLSLCFSDKLKLASVVNNNNNNNNNIIENNSSSAQLIDAISAFLKNNCILMEVLCRYAARSLDTICSGDCGFNASGEQTVIEQLMTAIGPLDDDVSEQIMVILEELVCCGGNSKDSVYRIVETVPGKNILHILLVIINGIYWKI
jgi:hypothetical protein